MTRQSLLTLPFATLARDDARGAVAFHLKSKDLADGERIAMKHVYNAFGCVGENLSPELSWDNPPAETKSFAVMVHDPDAPTGGRSSAAVRARHAERTVRRPSPRPAPAEKATGAAPPRRDRRRVRHRHAASKTFCAN
mgnify:CR=1 FL=1